MMKYFLFIPLLLCSICATAQGGKFVIHFPSNSSEIIAEEAGRLDSFVQTTEKAPMIVSGHTDSRGSNAYNEALSKRRADAVKSYLEADGFSVSDEKAFGETKPVVPDEGDELKGAPNRRVEIIFDMPAKTVKNTRDTEAVKPLPEERFIKDLLADEAAVKGSTLVLNNIYFWGGLHRFLPSSRRQLESLLDALKSNPKLKIAVEGHICCLPGDGDGLDNDTHINDLSYQRAKAVYDYLVDSGIDKSRLSFKGLGHKQPLYPFPEKSVDEMAANRRVEIRIVEK